MGRWIISHAAIPSHDLFTYTVADHRFVAHEWLSEVIMAALTSASGLAGPSIFFAVVTWLGFLAAAADPAPRLVPGRRGQPCDRDRRRQPIWGPRTQMITFAFTVALLLLLRRYRETRDRRWLYDAAPPMFVLWVNLHAGFTIGLVFLYITLVGEFLRSLESPLRGRRPAAQTTAGGHLVSTLAVAINPNTYRIYLYAAQTQFSSAQQKLIVEWFSPDFHRIELRAYEAMLLRLMVAAHVVQASPPFHRLCSCCSR